jgi:alpha-beta hydrolase superfamily lysophospholipase
VIGIRMPGHGTVPAGLTAAQWEDWLAATRLAVREARRRTDASAPLHMVGYSNGGALVTKYVLDALENSALARPDRVVLISPMIGVTRFARFASVAGWPAFLPAFAGAAWLDIVPEFNPFKYNSFPVNAARQSHRLTATLQEQIGRLAREGRMADIAPILTFQSVVDFTVSAPAILSALYAFLPANGSEIVLFDVNRSVKFSPLLRTSADTALARLTPTTAQDYAFTVVGNAGSEGAATVARTTRAGETTPVARALALPYPPQVFSLSHVALPMPLDDSLYGLEPVPGVEFGANLGTVAVRGERGALVVNMDFLTRLASNPFFPYMLERIEEGIDRPAVRASPSVTRAARTTPSRPDQAHQDDFADALAPSDGAP